MNKNKNFNKKEGLEATKNSYKIIGVILSLTFLFLFSFSIVSAISQDRYNSIDFLPHQQNTDLAYSFTSNNATQCNLTTGNTPDGLITINQIATRDGQTFNVTLDSNNFSTLGIYCFNIVCTDGSEYETGSFCKEVTPSGRNGTDNIVFILFIIIMIYAISFMGFFGKNEIVTLIGGMFMLALSTYLHQFGIIIYRDTITTYFAYITFGLGAFFSIISTISLIEDSLG